ncbi:MAG TPA: class I SAM-dependent methyltransferase [Candidatus Kapabacteria bacterium]
MVTAPTERFSSRVEAYQKYRPHYPREVIDALREKTGLKPSHIIADIGSGTGISAELFLANGNFVYAVEPNTPMRDAGAKHLKTWKNLRWIDGTAEATTLPDHVCDYVVAAQAFHWFDVEKTYAEFQRILKPRNDNPRIAHVGGWLVILWNDRQTDTTPFLKAYEELLLKYGTDYVEINHRNFHTKSAPDAKIQTSNSMRVEQFFHGRPILEMKFPNDIPMDYDGLKGRLVSSSYVPDEGEEHYDEMIGELKKLFDRYNSGGQIDMRYTTLLYAGQL